MAIRVAHSKLANAFAGDAHDVWLLLKHRPTVTRAVAEAVEETNEWAEPMSRHSAIGSCRLTIGADDGTALLFSTDGVEGSMCWIEHFSAGLDAMGATGSLTTMEVVSPPPMTGPLTAVSWPTATIFWSFDPTNAIGPPPQYAFGNLKPRTTKRSTVPLAEWSLHHSQGLGTIFLHALAGWSRIPVGASPEVIAAEVERLIGRGESQVDLLVVDPDETTSCSSTWHSMTSHTELRVMAPAPIPLWTPTSVERLRQALLHNASLLSLGFIESGGLSRKGFLPGRINPGSAPEVAEYLFERYTLDACGIQVLTGHHLERIQRLDRWLVNDLGNDRYLVEAPNLASWFRDEQEPDWDVREAAREDFADILITPDVLNHNRPPWRDEARLINPAPAPRPFSPPSFRPHLP